MADNMSANIVIKRLISGVVINVNYLSGIAQINLLKYDDPVDYLMFQNGVRMRTESDIYIKTEASA